MSDSSIFWAAFGGAAAAGVVTLIAVLAAEWFRWFIDRPLVKVSLSLGFLLGLTRDDTWYLFLEAKNPHTKTVTLSTFGLSFKRREWGTLHVNPQAGYQFPYKLDGGASIAQWSPVEDLFASLAKDGRAPSDLKWVWFKSSSGELFRSKIEKKTIEGLEKEFSKASES